MAEITPNPYKEEIDQFKEDMLKNLSDLESRLTSQITNKESFLNKDYNELTAKINTLIENNKEIVSNLATQKLKLDKINDLESFKNKVDGMLITHEIRIKNNTDEVSKMKLKYDKIITENLYVSGFIGTACQFKNVSEYLSYNISEVSKLKMEKEQLKKDLKDLKGKIEGLMKSMISLNDNSVKLCNKYTDNKQGEFRKMLESGQNELNSKSMEMRTMIVKFNNESDQKIVDLKEEFNKLLEMKSEFNNLIEQKYEDFEVKYEELNKKTMKNNDNIEINKKKLENVEEQSNNINKNINELSFQVRNYYCVSNKISKLLEKLRSNPSKNELTNLIIETQKISEANKNLSSSPQPKRLHNKISKVELNKFSLDDTAPIKNNNNPNINSKSRSNSPTKKRIYQKLNKIEFNNLERKDYHSDSEKSSMIIELEPVDKIEEKFNKEKPKENNNENIKEIINENTQEIKKEDIKEKIKNNALENIKEELNVPKAFSSQKQTKIIPINSSNTNSKKIKLLPILTIGNKGEDSKEEKSKKKDLSLETEKNNIEKNRNNKYYSQENIIKKVNIEYEPINKKCNIVNMNLPLSKCSKSSISIKKRNGLNDKGKYELVNSLINNYRAKLFSKIPSPEAIIENDILDIPKKVTQAFGRTTHNFLFKKDAIDCFNANRNINDFGYNGPKKKYHFKNNKSNNRMDTGIYKLSKNAI